ncbi:MAG: hypothetical protein FJ255_02585 [Phycisphaerae bacterium]|nr:hypothetical protein [Phycisphaerae bacterium]
MSRPGSAILALLGALSPAAIAAAQTDPPDQLPEARPVWAPASTEPADPTSPDAGLERFLSERRLDGLHAAHLRRQLAAARGADRLRVAERLGAIYVALLSSTTDAATRQRIEGEARELIRSVPDAESLALRLDLAKVTFIQAEEVVERHRMRLAEGADLGEAQRVLRTVQPVFEEIAVRADASLQRLERRVSDVRAGEAMDLQQRVAEARRVRSMSRYYSGWARYYLALTTGNKDLARQALVDFGVLLNAQPGRAPALDRVPRNTVRFEHVSRAVIGVALSLALRGEASEALRWMQLLEQAEQLSPAVRAQMLARRLVVLAAGGRWAEVETLVMLERRSVETSTPKPLEVRDARLLAVLTLEALPEFSGAEGRRRGGDLVMALAQTSLGDLIARGEVGHVLDLVKRYGTAPMGESGFVVAYVRGLHAFDVAREEHRAAGAGVEEPTSDPGLVNRYAEAAQLLEQAVRAHDAEKFPGDRAKAAVRAGMAHYLADRQERAADLFQRAATLAAQAGGGEQARDDEREALWYAIVALDRAVEGGRLSLVESRDRLATLFLERFPHTEQAARLLLRRAGEGLSDEQAVEVLLRVEASSPVYASARREAARRLYQVYVRSGGKGREFAGVRFADVAQETLELDAQPGQALAEGAAPTAVLRGRQLVMVLLDMPSPDVRRAERALELMESIAARHAVDLGGFQDELTYRRMRIALLRGEEESAVRALDLLRAAGGRYALAAERFMLSRAQEALRARPEDASAARAVVSHGARVLVELERSEDAWSGVTTPMVASQVAAAASRLWSGEQDRSMLDLALELDGRAVAKSRASGETLRRLAENRESAADEAGALDAWRLLLSASAPGGSQWFEARYQSLRLLARLDRARFDEALAQHKVLYPSLGPEPWGDRIRGLEQDPGGKGGG